MKIKLTPDIKGFIAIMLVCFSGMGVSFIISRCNVPFEYGKEVFYLLKLGIIATVGWGLFRAEKWLSVLWSASYMGIFFLYMIMFLIGQFWESDNEIRGSCHLLFLFFITPMPYAIAYFLRRLSEDNAGQL